MVGQKQDFPYRIEVWDQHDAAQVKKPDPTVVKAMQEIFDQIVIRGDELEDLLPNIVNAAYWQNLNPRLMVSLSHSADRSDAAHILPGQQCQALQNLEAHGYFALPQCYPPEFITNMRTGVDLLRSAGWPAVFAYVYDEFWSLFQSRAMVAFLRSHLGDYGVTANIWAHFVEPRAWSSGWPPHVDSGIDPRWLTVWIPLTDATLENGCIYVIPRDLVPQSLPQNYPDWPSVDISDLATILHSVRPLPARAGSILGWNHQLIHWGGRASDAATEPRISLAFEFIGRGVTPGTAELPLTEPGMLPDFPTRLMLIAKSIIKYKKFETVLRRYELVAKRMIEWSEQAISVGITNEKLHYSTVDLRRSGN